MSEQLDNNNNNNDNDNDNDNSPEFEPCDVCGGTEANFDGFCLQCEIPMDVIVSQ